jgi:hypothetical protein
MRSVTSFAVDAIKAGGVTVPTEKPKKDNSFLTRFQDEVYGDIKNITLDEKHFSRGMWLFKFETRSNSYVLSALCKDGFLKLLSDMGYFKRYQPDGNSYFFLQEIEGIIQKVKPVHIKDDLLLPENKIFVDLYFDYIDPRGACYNVSLTSEHLKELFLRNEQNVLNDRFLEYLPCHTKHILRDMADITLIFFSNGIVKVNKDGHEFVKYETLIDSCIWKDHIIDGQFEYNKNYDESHFGKFLYNIAGSDESRIESIKSGIGYLINNHCKPSNSRAVLCYDEEITDLKKPEGGTGKGVFANAIRQVRSVAKIDGKKFKPDDRFRWQNINESTQIVWVDDTPANLGFEVFHSVLTDGWNIEKKNQREFLINPDESPKLLLSSNSVIAGNGNTNKRRQFTIEFGPYYSNLQRKGISEPIRKIHGCTFFDKEEWNKEEWDLFYSFLVDCCQLYHSKGLVFHETKSLEKNKLLQETCPEFVDWVESKIFCQEKEYDTSDEFEDFKSSQFLDSSFKQRTFTAFLKKYASYLKLTYKPRKSNGRAKFSFN